MHVEYVEYDVDTIANGRIFCYISPNKDIADDDIHTISDAYNDMYLTIKNTIKEAKKAKIQKDVKSIMRRKTEAYFQSLKNQISHLFSSDKDFKGFMQDTIKKVRSGDQE
jgi:hypothetical protein